MRPQQSPGPSTSNPSQPSGQNNLLQQSSLLTGLSPEMQQSLNGIINLPQDQKQDQKIVSPVKPILAQLDSRGSIQINITVSASALTLVKLLGEGAYGSVYEGLWNDQAVAIKRLKAQHLTEKAIEELRQEAQIMFQLGVESKYIVPLKKICLEAPHYSLVMELMPNGSLYHLLHNGQDLPWAIRFQIALDAAWGLKDLHAYSILHRDLKSLNILLDDRLRARLADFGLAKVKQETSSQSTIAKGTVLWMAPELFKRKAEVTAAADIYSFGMVLWELVTREIPFKEAQNQLQAMGWIKDGEKEEIPGDCPPGLKTLIESCWDLTPTKRPTAGQVVERLKPLVIGQEQKIQTPVSSTAPESPKPAQVASSNDEEMKKLLAEVMRMKLEKAEDERRRVEFEKMAEEHARLKAEIEREREINRRETELKKSPVSPMPENPASLPPARQPDIKKPMTSEPVSSPSSVLSQSRFTIAPAPKSLIKPVDAKALEQLLRFVAEGEQDKAEALIQQDKNLLLHAGTVTDLSGREFKPITAFQYALWAMDWHMWKMIQKYLPEEQQREQFEVLETKGTLHGKHFSLQPLIGALQEYVDNAEKVWKYDQRAKDHWCKVVGGAQKALPAHVVNDYCRSDRPFEPCPQEWESNLPRTRETSVWSSIQSIYIKGSWFVTPSYKDGLGLNFAFYRSGNPGMGDCCWWERQINWWVAAADLKALQSLWKTRTQELESLKSELLSTASHSQTLQLDTPSSQSKLSSPEERSQHPPERLAPPEMKKLSISSKAEPIIPPSQNIYGLTAPKPESKPMDAKALKQLLQYVAEGEQDKAEVMIQKDKNLLLHAGTVTDLSGREFKGITAFQYALWAMDWHMWKMIQKYLPEEQQREQFEVLETKGTSHGKHFSLQPLIGALQVYVDNAEKVWKYDQRATNHWCKVVGGAQRGVPAHVVNEYCREDRSFDPCPAFTEEKLPRIRTSKYFPGVGEWFTAQSGGKLCGESFAYVRGDRASEAWWRATGDGVPRSTLGGT